MNCKPGDLAIVVKGKVSAGRIVKCIRIFADGEIFTSQLGKKFRIIGNSMWLVDGSVLRQSTDGNAYWVSAVSDSELRPIRPNDGEDEMIRIAGKPHDAHLRPKETA